MSSQELQMKIQRFESFIKIDPSNINLAIDLADLYVEDLRFEDALSCLQQVQTHAAFNLKIQVRLADLFLGQSRYAEAEKVYETLLEHGENDPVLHHNFALALFYQSQFERSLEHLNAAHDLGFCEANQWKYLAYCRHHLFQMEGATDACKNWIITSNGSLESRAYMCMLAFDSNLSDDARKFAEDVLKEDPDNVSANTVLGSLALEENEIDQAHLYFAKATPDPKNSGRAWLGQGLAYLYDDHKNEAISALSEATRKMPEHAGTVIALGWTLLSSSDFIGAEKSFRRAVEIDRNFAESHGGLASALVHLNRLEEAKAAIAIADKLNKANFGAIYAKAFLLKLNGREDASTMLISRALERSPSDGSPPLIDHLRSFLSRQAKTKPTSQTH